MLLKEGGGSFFFFQHLFRELDVERWWLGLVAFLGGLLLGRASCYVTIFFLSFFSYQYNWRWGLLQFIRVAFPFFNDYERLYITSIL